MWARLENNIVRELITFDPAGKFHPSLVWVECHADTAQGDCYDGAAFSKPAPVVPSIESRRAAMVCSPRQMRQALTRSGLRAAVESGVAAGSQDTRDWWEFATVFERMNPEVVVMGAALGKTPEDVDSVFLLAMTL